MRLLYNFFIYLYAVIIYTIAPFNSKAKKWINGRQKLFKNLKIKLQPFDNQKERIWIHCASLGEFEQARPVIEQIRTQKPNCFILLTFFSPSGYETRKNYKEVSMVSYLPIDTIRNAKKFLEIIKVNQIIFVKYEFWYNYMITAKDKKIPIYYIAFILRSNQYFFKWYGKWFREQLKNISHFFAQNTDTSNYLKSIGIQNVSVVGDPRFDRVIHNSQNKKSFPIIEAWLQNSKVLVIGSSWNKDIDLLINTINNFEGKIIVAPHEIKENNIQYITAKLKIPFVRYTNIQDTIPKECKILIINTIGILSQLYQYANFNYIGGGFGKGIHNTLEALAFGNPVLFGPQYKKFEEAKAIIKHGIGYTVQNQLELIECIQKIEANPGIYQHKIKKYLLENQGASGKIIEMIINL